MRKVLIFLVFMTVLGCDKSDYVYEDSQYDTQIVHTTPKSPVSPIPEPKAALLFGLGVLIVGAWTRKRSKNA